MQYVRIQVLESHVNRVQIFNRKTFKLKFHLILTDSLLYVGTFIFLIHGEEITPTYQVLYVIPECKTCMGNLFKLGVLPVSCIDLTWPTYLDIWNSSWTTTFYSSWQGHWVLSGLT